MKRCNTISELLDTVSSDCGAILSVEAGVGRPFGFDVMIDSTIETLNKSYAHAVWRGTVHIPVKTLALDMIGGKIRDKGELVKLINSTLTTYCTLCALSQGRQVGPIDGYRLGERVSYEGTMLMSTSCVLSGFVVVHGWDDDGTVTSTVITVLGSSSFSVYTCTYSTLKGGQ